MQGRIFSSCMHRQAKEAESTMHDRSFGIGFQLRSSTGKIVGVSTDLMLPPTCQPPEAATLSTTSEVVPLLGCKLRLPKLVRQLHCERRQRPPPSQVTCSATALSTQNHCTAAHLLSDVLIFVKVIGQHNEVRAQCFAPRHEHASIDAVLPRLIVGAGDLSAALRVVGVAHREGLALEHGVAQLCH